MIHLRLIVAPDLVPTVLDELRAADGVAHVVHVVDVHASPDGQLVLCDVAREAANSLVERLQHHGVHRRGAIAVSELESIVSDAAAEADRRAPGQPADALVWEELESRARNVSGVSVTFLVLMCIAAIIAGIGILLDAPILIVGAMVLGPEYGALSALCVAAVRRRPSAAAKAGSTLLVGLAVAAAVTVLAALGMRLTGIAPERYGVSDRQLTAFISHPDGLAAVVAVLAGVAGMLSLTSERNDALIGVLVSVTTIPAVGNIGVATAYGAWEVLGGSLAQLAINLTGLLVGGVGTLGVLSRRYRPDGSGLDAGRAQGRTAAPGRGAER